MPIFMPFSLTHDASWLLDAVQKDGRKVADLGVKTESHNSYPIGINQVRHLVSFPRKSLLYKTHHKIHFRGQQPGVA